MRCGPSSRPAVRATGIGLAAAGITWHEATSVEISGTSFPARTTFAKVGVKKKSFCGSLNSDKPCLHIDFGKFSADNEPADRSA